MAALNFTEKTAGSKKYYEATATVTADFNIHLERESAGGLEIAVTTILDGQYECAYSSKDGEVFDHDFQAVVYPKYIKVTSWSKVTSGAVTIQA